MKNILELRPQKTVFQIFLGQLFHQLLVSRGPISGLCRPVAEAEVAVGRNKYHEKFSPEFRQLTAIFSIFFWQLFLRIVVSLGPISGLCRLVAVARVVVGQQKYRDNFLSDFRLLKTIFLIFFGTTFFPGSWVVYHVVHFQVRHKSKAGFEKQFLYSS